MSFCNAGEDVPQFGSGVPGFPSAVIIVACDAELRFALIPLGIGTAAVRFADDELLELAAGTAPSEELLDEPSLEELSLEPASLDEPSLEELSLDEPSLEVLSLDALSLDTPPGREPPSDEPSLEAPPSVALPPEPPPSTVVLSLEVPPSAPELEVPFTVLSLDVPLSTVLSLELPSLESS